jgi:hypothetical protein
MISFTLLLFSGSGLTASKVRAAISDQDHRTMIPLVYLSRGLLSAGSKMSTSSMNVAAEDHVALRHGMRDAG